VSVNRTHTAAGVGVLATGAWMAWGAAGIPAEAGYAGVGPNFLPWVVALALMVCGALLAVQGWRGGWATDQTQYASEGAASAPDTRRADWPALAWMAAGVALNASLITQIGFILSCALCFVLAVRGLRLAEGKAARGWAGGIQALKDLLVGAAIAAPVFWIFTKLLNIGLPGLTGSGWL
jgi:putative tricarboxylic transport membrane protein